MFLRRIVKIWSCVLVEMIIDTTKVSLDCTKCKGDLEQVSEGNVIKFYFFKYNIDGETVKIERIVR